MSLGERLVALRRQRGWNQRTLALAAGVDHSWLSRLERGQRKNMSLRCAIRLARVLGVSLDVLAGVCNDE